MLGKITDDKNVTHDVIFKGDRSGYGITYPDGTTRSLSQCEFSFLNSCILIKGFEWIKDYQYQKVSIIINDVKSGEDV